MRRRLVFYCCFKTLDISQGSVATQLRCGEIFIANFASDSDSEILLKIG